MNKIIAPIPQNRVQTGTAVTRRAILRLRAQAIALERENARLREENAALKLSQRNLQEERARALITGYIVDNVGHELKTPLLQVKAAISSLAEVSGKERLIELAKQSTARLEDTIQNLVRIAQVTKNTHPSLEPATIRDPIDYALNGLAKSWTHHKNVERVQVMISPHLPPVQIDKRSIGIVIQMLLDNALKFSKDAVHLKADCENDRVIVSIQDFGEGIAPELLERIFELFVQGDLKSTRSYGGLGVGLALVRMILERHDTLATVESTVGKGSTFSFTLRTIEL
ncbi:MAG: ATP-binding protein [Chloroflexota bacterium]|nr:ATP-binding protein [Chloroflexota bacterium]